MKEDESPSCLILFLIAGAAFVIYVASRIIQFFQRPDALYQILQTLKTVGLCLGAGIGLAALLVLYSLFASRQRPAPKLHRRNREYAARCWPVRLVPSESGMLAANLPEAPGQEVVQPLDARLALTNYGLYLALLATNASTAAPMDEDNSHLSGAFIIPIGSLCLDQQPYRTDNGPDSGVPIQIVIVFTEYKLTGSLEQTRCRGWPLKLALILLDRAGRYDPAATRRIFAEIEREQQAIRAAEDDSWMYRSRPWMGW